MKNYVKECQKLPLYGIGPYLVYSMVLLPIICDGKEKILFDTRLAKKLQKEMKYIKERWCEYESRL